jgi:hypothetical protein
MPALIAPSPITAMASPVDCPMSRPTVNPSAAEIEVELCAALVTAIERGEPEVDERAVRGDGVARRGIHQKSAERCAEYETLR